MAIDWQNALARAQAEAPFLAQALRRQPELADRLAAGDGAAALAWAKQAGDSTQDVAVALRREKLALATALAIGDLAGAFPLSQVMGELSEFADRALTQAINAAIIRRMPDAQPHGMFGLALGKHGAGELNYSSDIDPILLYDPDTLPRRERDEPGEAAQRYAREVVNTLSENTAEGYVFRVDLRLRPASEVSPLAISCPAALSHYESSALAWERAAFIRARSASGDIAAGEEFLAAINNFIWRSSLDYGAIEEIRRLTQRIRANYDGPQTPGAEFDLKHGRGGIREIEFFAQTHQLIHGGRDRSLRVRGTRGALDALANSGHIPVAEASALGDAYDRLRVIEHRLQMVNDRQTHALPSGDALDSVARLDGLDNGAALVAEITQITDRVAAAYDTLIGEDEGPEGLGAKPASLSDQLSKRGFADPGRLAQRIAGWRDGRYRALRSPAALSAFDALLPALIDAFADADDPDRALLRWESLLTHASSAINLFRLLEARPALLDQLVAILTLAPTLADELGRRPGLLDTLIDHSALDLPGSVEQLAARMEAGVTPGDYERQLDRIRLVTGEVRFALGLQLIEAHHDPLEIAEALSRTAEAALLVAYRATCEEFASNHGRVEGPDGNNELIVLGLGRFGGGALTHASDLDIIFLFTGESGTESNGKRPLGATHYFNRLAQRISGALSVPTAQGALYEVDTRLRPQGTQGPLAVTVEAFARYQRESAWTWEHMALNRARVLVGSGSVHKQLSDVIEEVLHQPRDLDNLRDAVLTMRRDMAAHKPPKGPLDAKLLRGGLVDLEFLVHYLQLRDRTAFSPDLSSAIAQLCEAGLLPQEVAPAHRLMTRLLVAGRLLAPDQQPPPPAASKALAKACQQESFDALLQALSKARHGVAQAWHQAFGIELEIET
ncbi:MAG: bifunctional [glutamate--ammonia ligase]-adenylyl-L-tyrosine phosphorylase/[glutamate--ammonia-ligase] adenylyltransferase [Erythrobacter sp.]